MNDILTVHASRSNNQNKTSTSSQRRNLSERCHSSVGYSFTSAFLALEKVNIQRYQQQKQNLCFMLLSKSTSTVISITMWRSYFHPPLPRHLVVGVVVTTDAEAKELAGGALDLEPLDLQGTLKEPVAGLKVPVAAPQEMNTADGQEVSGGQSLQKGLELVWMTERDGVRGQIAKQRDKEWRESVVV